MTTTTDRMCEHGFVRETPDSDGCPACFEEASRVFHAAFGSGAPPGLTVKRRVWMTVYAWNRSPNTTLRELYWSEESAMKRAAELMPHCHEVFVGSMAELIAEG